MDPLEKLTALLRGSQEPSPQSQQDLLLALSKPAPSPHPKEKSLADVLKDSVVASQAARSNPGMASAVDLLADIKKRAEAAPAPTVKIFPTAASAFANIAKKAGARESGVFSGIDAVSSERKKRGRKHTPWQDDPDKAHKVEALSLQILKEMGDDYRPNPRSSIADAHFRAGVQQSFELERILAVPRRPSDLTQYPDQTDIYKRPGGTMRLWPIQSAILIEAALADGLLGPVGVGHGKTLASLLVGVAMRAKKIVLLVPPQLRAQLVGQDIPHLNKHWKLPLEELRIVAYSELSNARSAEILEQLAPDLLIADECHALRYRSAARTKRFLRYFKEHPECRFVGLSGTITRRSLKDYQHLSELALHKNSPLPAHFHALEDWARAIDVTKKDPMPPGALLQLCTEEEKTVIDSMPTPFDGLPYIRQAFRRRLVETPGVVATEESALGTSLVITGLRPQVPDQIEAAIERLHGSWQIDDEELLDAMSVARVGRQLAGGFFYRWVWPDGVKDHEWLGARKAWNRELRDILKLSRKGLDSPMLVVGAIERGDFVSATYPDWKKVKNRYNPTPPTETVWLDKFLVKETVAWAKKTCSAEAPGIIWYQWDSLGRAIAQEGGLPFFGPGNEAAQELTRINVKKSPVIVASIAAHGTGKNLQMFSRNLFTTPPSGGVEWEQTMARTHRPGQEADEVEVDVYLHTDDMVSAWWSALRDARYIEDTQGQKQKILYATRVECEDGGA